MQQQNDDFLIDEQTEESGNGFGLDTLISFFVLYWYWIVISMAVCFAAANLYLRYQPSVYQASVKILIKDANSSRRASNGSSLGLEEMGTISNSLGFLNEMEILGSSAIAKRVVKSLKLYTSYRFEGRVKDAELYRDTPLMVDIAEENLDNLNTNVNMVFTEIKGGFHVDGSVGGNPEEKPTFSYDLTKLPATINTTVGTISIMRNPGYDFGHRAKLYATISPVENMGRVYAGKMFVDKKAQTGSVATAVITETQTVRALHYLNELVNCYNEDANEDKNEVARKTQAFLDARIDAIRGELDITEGELETFKKTNELINLPNDASLALGSRNQYYQQQVEMQTQLTLMNSLIEYVSNPDNAFHVIPSNLGLVNSALVGSIDKYNDNVLLRNRLLKTGSETNPAIIKVTAELEAIWPTLATSLKAIYQDMLVRKKSIDEQYADYAGKTHESPTLERHLNNIGRQQESKAGLYLMLLQKREQNYISLASTASKARMIDAPIVTGKVSPNEQRIKLGALGVGFIIPVAIFYLLALLRYRIEGRADVERLTKIPILADIPLAGLAKDERAIVVAENTNSSMEEAFRGLRTNLRFVMSKDEQVIACTSCIPSEGKTFVASNLAMSFALLGKRVVLVGLDIRKPQFVKLFNLRDSKTGITNYLSGDVNGVEGIDNLIFPSGLNKNLDVLPSGTIPPNPAELVARPQLDEIVNYLKTKYDYVVLDTPPLGLVSDTLEIARVADASIFVVRADYSVKANFGLINAVSQEGKMPKVNLVLNGIDLTKRSHSYYYGYGKYGKYSSNSKYGYYSHLHHYGHYGTYGNYGEDNSKNKK